MARIARISQDGFVGSLQAETHRANAFNIRDIRAIRG
jgi:hypothetical protein